VWIFTRPLFDQIVDATSKRRVSVVEQHLARQNEQRDVELPLLDLKT
jgi:hypothetical protein